jgi:hypothetical protein
MERTAKIVDKMRREPTNVRFVDLLKVAKSTSARLVNPEPAMWFSRRLGRVIRA